jgi:hypothetical protein
MLIWRLRERRKFGVGLVEKLVLNRNIVIKIRLMNVTEIIRQDEPEFTGVCVIEGYTPLSEIRRLGISLAWTFNLQRVKNYKKVLIAGKGDYKGQYFTAEIEKVVSVAEVYAEGKWEEAIDLNEEIFGTWISERVSGVVKDDTLNERLAIIFKNPSEIKQFHTQNFRFNRNSFAYIHPENNIPTIQTDGEYIEIANIGKIKEAKIKLNGLTVISGVNDTGKSTVGKLLFSIVKAISRFEEDLNEGKEKKILNNLESLYYRLRRTSGSNIYGLIREEFEPRKFFSQLKNYIEESQISLFNFDYTLHIDNERVSELINFKQNLLEEFNLPNRTFVEIKKYLNEIKYLLLNDEDKEDQIRRAFSRALFSEFHAEISPKNFKGESTIKYHAGQNNILNINISENKVIGLEIKDDLVFKDVTYIETPLILQLFSLIQSSETLFEDDINSANTAFIRHRPKTSLHTKDLVSKIESAKYFTNNLFEDDFESIDIVKKISKIINGGFIFDEDSRDFVFSKVEKNKKNSRIKPLNTASGIKSFGIIQLLLQANILNDKSLLILDEPENHLHPQWQIEYAKMIIELVKNNISVIIASHSPYMIQALKHFSAESNIEQQTNFYYANPDKNGQSIFEDVTDNLNIVFQKLAEPLRDLVWQQ